MWEIQEEVWHTYSPSMYMGAGTVKKMASTHPQLSTSNCVLTTNLYYTHAHLPINRTQLAQYACVTTQLQQWPVCS